VISPEGCATILWKSAEKASEAARLWVSRQGAKSLGLIDQIVEETPGGAHRDAVGMAKNLKQALEGALARVGGLDHDALVRRRIVDSWLTVLLMRWLPERWFKAA
jgi:acetyl-CoA carboxylase carboxyl transferase subunit alpha